MRWNPKYCGLVPPYTAVMVAWSTVPNRPNCEFWVLLQFYGNCMKTCEDLASKFGENRPGCFNTTAPHLTLLSSPRSFWWNTKWLSSLTHHTPLIWHPVTSSYFQKINWSWKDAGLILTLCRSYLKPYCMGRKTAFFFSGHLVYILQQERFRAFRPARDI
jgi:hypothetical protein